MKTSLAIILASCLFLSCGRRQKELSLTTTLTVAYSQIYLEDYSWKSHSAKGLWKDEEFNSMLCVRKRFLVIGTAQSIQAPFHVDIVKDQPEIDLKSWDHVNECSIEITAGLLISGDFDDENEMLRFDLKPGFYGVFVCYNGLGTISDDGLKGDDSYQVFMWPTSHRIPKRVLKQWKK